MLQYLKIQNLALIDEVTLEFDSGFTAVTGETGAGKSVLLGAIALLSGARGDKSVIKQGADFCHVEASLYFEHSERIDNVLENFNLPSCEENTLILSRTLYLKKSGRILVNGGLAPIAVLEKLGRYWVDFHGPGEPQKLFHRRYQLQMLDLYAGLAPLLRDYADQFSEWKGLLKEADELASQEKLTEDEIDFYKAQIDKINAVNPSPEAIEELESDFNRYSRSQEVGELAGNIDGALGSEGGIIEQLQGLLKPAQELSEIDKKMENAQERLKSLIIECQDVAGEYSNLMESFDNESIDTDELEKKMNHWLEVKRQYGPSLEAIVAKRDQLSKKLSDQTDIAATVEKLKKEASVKEKGLQKIAGELTKKRELVSKDLAKKVEDVLKKLGFKKAGFEIQVAMEDGLKEYGDSGVEFLFAPNLGQSAMPLNKIASSGETARVMLALKSLLAKVDQTPLLVFDEVDANIGGEIGVKVAQELAKLSHNHQVFCVTHLPQVASQAKNHYLVSKEQENEEACVRIGLISSEKGRISELARMLGDRASKSAQSHAKELLGK